MFENDDSSNLVLAIAAVGFFTLTSGYSAYSAYDLENNYEPVEAKITGHKTDCFIEVRSDVHKVKYLSTKGRIKNACYDTVMSCKTASKLAKKYGFSKLNIKKRVKITYQYQSPIDGALYKGKGRLIEPSKRFMRKKKISVLASKKHPYRSAFGDDVEEQIK